MARTKDTANGGEAGRRGRATATGRAERGDRHPHRPSLGAPGYCTFDTSLGYCAVAWSAAGLSRVLLPEGSVARTRARLRRELPESRERRPPPAVRAVIERIGAHLNGEPQRFDTVVLDLGGASRLARQVYAALRATGPGQTTTYGALAERAGAPRAARAVGGVLSRNPLPIVIPCHRVIRADRGAGGFSAEGGIATKARLLALEGAEIDQPWARAVSEPKSRAARAPVRGRTAEGERLPPLFEGEAALPFDASAAVRHLRQVDPRLGRLIDRVGPMRLKLDRRASTFAALSEAIVYQQLTGKAAATIGRRLREQVAAGRALAPKHIAAATDEALRAAGLSRAKAAALRDLATRCQARRLPTRARLAKLDDEAVVAALTRVRGVGRWTAEMLLIFQLGRPDVLPATDYGVRKGFARAFGLREPPPADEVGRRGRRWRPYRTAASWYLWRATDLPD